MTKRGGIYFQVMAVLVICIVVGSIFELRVNIPAIEPGMPTPSTTSTGTLTPTSMGTETPVSLIIESPPNTSTNMPIPIGDIDVLEWNVEYVCRGPLAIEVRIVGAVITGGIPPYSVHAEYRNGTPVPQKYTSSKIVIFHSSNKVTFGPPIIVSTGKYLKYRLTSSSPNGKPDYAGTWYFPSDAPECGRKQP